MMYARHGLLDELEAATWGGEFVLSGSMGAVQGTVFGTELQRQYDLVFETLLFGEGMRDVSVSKMRCFVEALRRAAQAKGRQCFHPFCDRPAAECQIDHRIPASKGGPTALWNSQPGCAFHNGGKGATMPTDEGPAP